MQHTLGKVNKLIELRMSGAIPRLHQHEVNPGLDLGSRENYLYFTLPVALNFQRSSPALWTSALTTWHDLDTRYLFFPEQAVTHPFEKIQADLIKHKLGLQKNKHTQIRMTLCASLHHLWQNDPRVLLAANAWDVDR